MSNVTKNEIGQLLYQHSADLVWFSAVKREDERLQELEFAIQHGYMLIPLSIFISIIFMISVAIIVARCKPPAVIKQEKSFAEERENLQQHISFIMNVAELLHGPEEIVSIHTTGDGLLRITNHTGVTMGFFIELIKNLYHYQDVNVIAIQFSDSGEFIHWINMASRNPEIPDELMRSCSDLFQSLGARLFAITI
ncbi:hypothetical protein Ddc_18163 [Ditylenchus destructor]|nr:hypothetical protein Ddc_18163 [Ditylenchus destructor]